MDFCHLDGDKRNETACEADGLLKSPPKKFREIKQKAVHKKMHLSFKK
jgi:hypothetical protein